MADGTSQEDRFHKYVATTVSLLPAFTVAALTIAVSYNVTYLYFAGALDVAPMTLLDVTSKAWAIVPVAVFYVAAQIAAIWIASAVRASKKRDASPQPMPRVVILVENAMIAFGAVILVATPPAIAVGRGFADNNIDVLKTAASGGLLMLSGFTLLAFGRVTTRFPAVARLTALYGLLIGTLGTAAINGADSVLGPNLSLVRYGDSHLFCGRLITVLERGVIVYEPTYGVKKFIPNDEVKSIETPTGCRLADKPPTPKK